MHLRTVLISLAAFLLILGLITACVPSDIVKEDASDVDEVQQREAVIETASKKEKERSDALLRYEEMVKEHERKQLEQQTRNAKIEQSIPDTTLTPEQPAPITPVARKQRTAPLRPAQLPKTKLTYRSDRALAEQNRLYDPNSESYDMIQKANESMKGFPTNRIGEVDWMAAIDQQLIAPRSDVQGTSKPVLLDLDIIMKDTRDMDYVRFPHLAHAKWLACTNCHAHIFKAKNGAQLIDMNKIFSGQYCGVCHDKVAFSVYTCENCHSVPH